MGRSAIGDTLAAEAAKRYGTGRLFYRTDGVSNLEEEVRKRREYVEAHPELTAEVREAILAGVITPGMSRDEVVVAWSLDDHMPAGAFGRKALVGSTVYATWVFRVGGRYRLYLEHNTLAGVRPE